MARFGPLGPSGGPLTYTLADVYVCIPLARGNTSSCPLSRILRGSLRSRSKSAVRLDVITLDSPASPGPVTRHVGGMLAIVYWQLALLPLLLLVLRDLRLFNYSKIYRLESSGSRELW